VSVGRLLALPLIWLVRAYQLLISPLTPPSCRYYPSCSAYAVTALERFGPIKGTYLAAWRVLRCNPWSPGGVDHVPPRHPHRHDAEPAEPTEPAEPAATDPIDDAVATDHQSTTRTAAADRPATRT
jgi:hypothetical protein